MRRIASRFVFDGKFVQGHGRYNDEANQVLIKGIGTSTFFLHGDIQLRAVVPTDPSRPTSGAATSFDRNTNSNSSFGIDLTGSTADVDRAGRPTKFTFTIDKNLSGGVFGQANGTGTVTIRYIPDGHRADGITSQGRAIVLITGDIYTLKTNNSQAVLGTTNLLRPNKIRF